ncbi:hypothetical protein RRG08_030294 [Elysia crispata]|uniref:Uncharacterized protein n=1 Tax=Elysia crispata TaxID=231223 RepID=A0AAE0ZX65_9GAST|nr:hypothetical protein RRG08_030294 [Elysia crispata]
MPSLLQTSSYPWMKTLYVKLVSKHLSIHEDTWQQVCLKYRLEQILGGKRKGVCIRNFFIFLELSARAKTVTGFLFLGGVKCRPQETFLSQCHVGLGKVKSTDTQHHSLFFLEIVIRPTNKMWVIWTPSCW